MPRLYAPARLLRVAAAVVIACAGGMAAGTGADIARAANPDTDGDGLRDRFETRWGVSDPHRRDTDQDGLLDPAEDPDHDQLGNLGEQRFGTSPISNDTDGDGIPDGAEDANGNGISNRLEQDRRGVPAILVPSLGDAREDAPASWFDGCHTRAYDATVRPCVYGDRTATTTIVLYGDSHAEQWLPALSRNALLRHWRIVAITKSGCPIAHVQFVPARPTDDEACYAWRNSAEGWLAANPPSLVVLSAFTFYKLLDENGVPIADDQREARWVEGLTESFRQLPGTSRRLFIADTPLNAMDVPICLGQNLTNISACATPRRLALSQAHGQAERSAIEAEGATYIDLNGLICPYDPCPPIVGDLLLWRNTSHLTATYTRHLSLSLTPIVFGLLAAP